MRTRAFYLFPFSCVVRGRSVVADTANDFVARLGSDRFYLGFADLLIHPAMFAESCYSLRMGRTVSG
jgi:hypothetical protein